ncbi:S8 family peptidase [Myroides sp. M-43]|uniref:S8 family peptidase n=1 Tax=Myroides oncorhynchi TaxID=2893756 RepID=UPI001E2907AC|nr:S8 family peptidase [Myroides oncorhynchi]MCC9043653.1 S8 family peptidase [Myroides oncorhynchi]
MKKILLTTFLLFAIWSQNALGQNLTTRNAIRSTYDIEASSKQINEYAAKAEINRKRAFAVAKNKSLPTSGINARGNYFELSSIDDNGILIYKTTLNAGSRITARAENIPTTLNGNTFLEGEGMLIGLVDGLPLLDTHQEFFTSDANRISRATLKETVPEIFNHRDSIRSHQTRRFHATHVGGTIAALGLNPEAKGIAPKAKLWSYSWNDDYKKMSDMAIAGIVVSNHSYGFDYFDNYGNLQDPRLLDYFGAYLDTAVQYDRLAINYPYYQPVLAAGNDGDLQSKTYRNTSKENCNCDMLNGGGVSKNMVVVAAVEQVVLYTGASSVRLAYFSSQGPTNDFRIKPDISAKGVDVFSSTFVVPNPLNATPGIGYYVKSNGTSMAAPAVTGVFALWQEWATKFSSKPMPYKSATIRALMAHTADEAGAAPGPDHLFGWGLINAKAGIDVLLAAKDKRSTYVLEQELKQGEKFTKEIYVGKDRGKMVVTLSWTDPEGTLVKGNLDEEYMKNNPLLINDLNVVVKKGNEVFYPWRLTKDFNNLKAEKGVNDVDNIEKIEIMDLTPGKYTIEVSHSKTLKAGKQEYSLISTVGKFDDLKPEDKEQETGNVDEIRLWPNPVVNELFVTVGEKYNGRTVNIRVFDINGRLIGDISETVEQAMVSVNMSGYNANVYIVEVKTFDSSKTVRIVKK